MEQNFQTSFIPKKPIIEERAVSPRPVGLMMVLSLILLFAMIIASGGLYFYRGVLNNDIEKMKQDLTLAKNRFEPSRITELQVLDKRLRASKEILDNHVAMSPLFEALEDVTMKTIRFTKFNYATPDEKNPQIKVKMSGVAVGYRSIALQSDLLSGKKVFIDPVFSNLSLDNSGNVLFDLEFSLDKSFADYQQMLLTNKPL